MKNILPRFAVGGLVICRGRECEIKQILTVRTLLVQATRGGDRPEVADVLELKLIGPTEPEATGKTQEEGADGAKTDAGSEASAEDEDSKAAEEGDEEETIDRRPENTDLEHISEAHLLIAKKRREIIRPLLYERTTAQVVARATEYHVSVAAIYRWIAAFRRTERLTSLVPRFKMRGGPTKSRIQKESNDILVAAIKKLYLTDNRLPKVEVAREVIAQCRAAKLKPPCITSVRNRINALSEKLVTRHRKGPKAARRFRGAPGTLQGALQPWSIVHMDHTLLSIMIVDRETRQPIGRPTITLAEDAYSRMIVGFYLSLEAPSALSVGICLADAMLPKDRWLAEREISGDWPVWGRPEVLHVDNAPEFWSRTLDRACDENQISLQHRRAGIPEDAGRIERLIQTVDFEVQKLPGTTFSNPQARGEYDSEAKAVLTLDELEYLIGDWIVNVYHRREHGGLGGRPPLAVWNEGLTHAADVSNGLPAPSPNPTELRMSFLPCSKRTLQRTGVRWDGLTYWNSLLTTMLSAQTLADGQKPRAFLVRRDPRDISSIWLWDHKRYTYLKLDCDYTKKRPMSLWELRETRRLLREQGRSEINEEVIFAARDRQREKVAQAERETKHARMMREREARRREGAAKHLAPAAAPATAGTPPSPPAPAPAPASALAFDDISF